MSQVSEEYRMIGQALGLDPDSLTPPESQEILPLPTMNFDPPGKTKKNVSVENIQTKDGIEILPLPSMNFDDSGPGEVKTDDSGVEVLPLPKMNFKRMGIPIDEKENPSQVETLPLPVMSFK